MGREVGVFFHFISWRMKMRMMWKSKKKDEAKASGNFNEQLIHFLLFIQKLETVEKDKQKIRSTYIITTFHLHDDIYTQIQ